MRQFGIVLMIFISLSLVFDFLVLSKMMNMHDDIKNMQQQIEVTICASSLPTDSLPDEN